MKVGVLWDVVLIYSVGWCSVMEGYLCGCVVWRCVLVLVWCGVVWCGVVWCGVVWVAWACWGVGVWLVYTAVSVLDMSGVDDCAWRYFAEASTLAVSKRSGVRSRSSLLSHLH